MCGFMVENVKIIIFIRGMVKYDPWKVKMLSLDSLILSFKGIPQNIQSFLHKNAKISV